jgi:hypothetical protein
VTSSCIMGASLPIRPTVYTGTGAALHEWKLTPARRVTQHLFSYGDLEALKNRHESGCDSWQRLASTTPER